MAGVAPLDRSVRYSRASMMNRRTLTTRAKASFGIEIMLSLIDREQLDPTGPRGDVAAI
jgi:hypothetical protein